MPLALSDALVAEVWALRRRVRPSPAETVTPVSPLVALTFEVAEDGPRVDVELAGRLCSIAIVER